MSPKLASSNFSQQGTVQICDSSILVGQGSQVASLPTCLKVNLCSWTL
jgi:hypothetical protein